MLDKKFEYFWEIQNIKWRRRDMVVTNKNTIYVLEVKVNWTVKEALEQIKQKYIPQLPIDKEIVKIWINWNKDDKSFWVEIV